MELCHLDIAYGIDKMKITIYKIKCPMCCQTAYEGKMCITDIDVNNGYLNGITCSSCGDDFDYEMPQRGD